MIKRLTWFLRNIFYNDYTLLRSLETNKRLSGGCKMINTAVNNETILFDQDIINQILIKIAQGKKIIILGANWKSVVFRRRYDVDIAYYVVVDYSEEIHGKTYDNIEIRSIYDIAYEKRGSFYVICADINSHYNVQHSRLNAIGLKINEDFCLIDSIDESKHVTDDSHLHYSIKYELPGIKIFGNLNDKKAVRILALGGSTTAANVTCTCGSCWPHHLFDLLQRMGIAAVVYNCGMSAFGSPREFIKLCRDGLTLKPHLVISYSGRNDQFPNQEFFPNRYNKPWVDHWTETQAREAMNHINNKMMYGLDSDMTQAESWVMHMKMMRGVCNELGINFAGFFQSYCGTNGKPSEYENILLYDYLQPSWISHKSSFYRAFIPTTTFEAIAEYADSITSLIEDIPYIFNKRYLYKGNTELLIDCCHTMDAGNHLIAQNVFKALLENGYFEEAK